MIDLEEYTREIDLAPQLVQRIREIQKFVDRVLGERDWQVFCNNISSASGEFIWDSLWFFNDRLTVECKQFLSSDSIDCDAVVLKSNIIYYRITSSHYDFGDDPRITSQLAISVRFPEQLSAELHAVGVNTKYLRDIFRTYILPNQTLGQQKNSR